MRRRFLATVMAFAMCATVVTPAIAQPKPTAAAPAATSSTLPSSTTDETKVPHYFGPYSNWANSPQVLANAIVTIAAPALPTPVVVGNQLTPRAFATDTGVVFGVVSGTALPAGSLSNFQVWNQADPTAPSAGNTFHAYVLRPTANPGEYTVAFDSGLLTMPALADPLVSELATFAAGPFAVLAGDVIAWSGQGIPLDVATGTDQFVFPAPRAPVANDVITLGTAPFVTDPVARTYSIAATVVPPVAATGAAASATVDPKTGGITAITVTDPGSGYTAAPAVTITSPGVTPTTPASATAQISPGVVNAVTVYEAGFGFSAPQVVFTGGNPTTPAIAQASGGVDNVTITSGGSYAVQPLVEFGLPNLGPLCAPPTLTTGCYTQATGTATMNASGVVDSVTVANPGSGYTSAPSVTIWDGTLTGIAPTPAVTVATIGIAQVDITNGGSWLRLPADRRDPRRRHGRPQRQRAGHRGRARCRHGHHRDCCRLRLPDAGPQEVRRHAARPRADGAPTATASTSRSRSPTRRPTRARTTTRSRSSSTASSSAPSCRPPCCAVTCSSRRASRRRSPTRQAPLSTARCR